MDINTGTTAASGEHSIKRLRHCRLPAAGYRNGTTVNNVGTNGNYWSSSANDASNARNMNFNAGNVNPMNNNNRRNGLTVRLVQENADADPLLIDLFKAYRDARRHKRNTRSQLQFELDLEKNIVDLYHRLRNRTYRPEGGVCFIVDNPVKREVFASRFKDRVVHHLYYNYVSAVFERSFIHDSYSCRKGKGTLYGIERFEHHLRSATNNYSQTQYVLQMDLKGFFMSINRELLYDIVQSDLRKYWNRRVARDERSGDWPSLDFLLWLSRVIICKNPLENCVFKGNASDWEGLPPSKSLLKQKPGIGLPIGDLTSQLFSNVLLNRLDQFVKRRLKVVHYGRYVDDFFLIGERGLLRNAKSSIAAFVSGLGLRVHPVKVSLHNTWCSAAFVGAVVKPHQRYCCSRVIRSFKGKALCYHRRGLELTSGRLPKQILSVINSYRGLLSHFKAEKVLNKCLEP